MQKENRTRRPRLASIAYQVGRTIAHRLYTSDRYDRKADEKLCKEIAPLLRELTELAGVTLPENLASHPHADSQKARELFIEALRPAYDISDLIQLDKATDADRELHTKMFALFDKIHAACDRSDERSAKAKRKKQGERKVAGRKTVGAGFDWPYFGVHDGDRLTIEESGQAPIGKLVQVRYDDGSDRYYIQRVCTVQGDCVRVTNDIDEPEDIDASRIVGPVVSVSHDGCTQTKIEALREQINKLEASDDAITNTTQIYKLEREIYDLEHPIAEEKHDEEEFEWPDEIDG